MKVCESDLRSWHSGNESCSDIGRNAKVIDE